MDRIDRWMQQVFGTTSKSIKMKQLKIYSGNKLIHYECQLSGKCCST